jgi:hypothetical protein
MNSLQKAMHKSTFGKMGEACGVSKTAVSFWFHKGRLPHTEYLPDDHKDKTRHADKLIELLGCKREDLL